MNISEGYRIVISALILHSMTFGFNYINYVTTGSLLYEAILSCHNLKTDLLRLNQKVTSEEMAPKKCVLDSSCQPDQAFGVSFEQATCLYESSLVHDQNHKKLLSGINPL